MDPGKKRHFKYKNVFSNINSENLLKNIWQVSSNSIIVALFNLAFHLILSRKLGPALYGEMQTLLNINNIILIALAAVSFIVAKFVSYYKTRQQFDNMKFLANWAFIFFAIVGCAMFILNLMFSKILGGFLSIDSSLIIIFGAMIWMSFLMPIIEGILRGLQEFKFIGKYKMLDAILRLTISAILVYAGLRLHIIFIGLIIGSLITVLSSLYILRKVYINKPHKIMLKEIYKFALPVFLACIFFAVLSSIDLVLVKHFLTPEMAGFFAAAGMLAKVSLGLAWGSAGVMFPKIVEDFSNGETNKGLQTMRNTLKIYLTGGGIITLLLALFPHQAGRLFFGNAYDIGGILTIYSFACFFLGASAILMMHDLAVKRYSFVGVLFITAFILVWQILKNHTTIYDIAWALFFVNALLLFYMIVYNRKYLFERIR